MHRKYTDLCVTSTETIAAALRWTTDCFCLAALPGGTLCCGERLTNQNEKQAIVLTSLNRSPAPIYWSPMNFPNIFHSILLYYNHNPSSLSAPFASQHATPSFYYSLHLFSTTLFMPFGSASLVWCCLAPCIPFYDDAWMVRSCYSGFWLSWRWLDGQNHTTKSSCETVLVS